LPAPAQGAITIACREGDNDSFDACRLLNDTDTELCTKVERDFLRALLGGCSTPISALAEIKNNELIFKGNILSIDGKDKLAIEKRISIKDTDDLGTKAAHELLNNGGQKIADSIRNGGKD